MGTYCLEVNQEVVVADLSVSNSALGLLYGHGILPTYENLLL